MFVIQAIKEGTVKPGDVIVLICAGGMEKILQVTGALKHLSWGKDVAVLTDGWFSSVSTGACIGHIAPEALAGDAIGKVLDGNLIQLIIDCNNMEGSVDLIGDADSKPNERSAELGVQIFAERPSRPDLAAHPNLPNDTRL